MATRTVFEAPGPGSWRLDSSHQDRPYSRWLCDRYGALYDKGMADSFADYGFLLQGVAFRCVNGFSYTSPLPPSPPTFPERFARAQEVFATKYWRTELERWDQEQKPAFIATHLALQEVVPHALDDAELRAHLGACVRAFDDSVYLHHRVVSCCCLPVGDYVAHATRWSGASKTEVLATLEGSSPYSVPGAAELVTVAELVAADARLRTVLDSGTPSDVLAELSRDDGPAGAAVRSWLELMGDRTVTGLDVAHLSGREMPSMLLQPLKRAVHGGGEDRSVVVETKVSSLRARVPDEHRAQFDALLEEARLVNRLRDERMPDNDMWATGLMRRALLEAGRRLSALGRLHDASHVFGMTQDELLAVLDGGGGPSADDLEDEERYRVSTGIEGIPETLGPPPSPPPPMDKLPPAPRRMAAAMMTYIHTMFDDAPERDAPANVAVSGLPGGNGSYTGIARVVRSHADFARVAPGDVLVAQMTVPSHNVLFSIVGAVVTDRGGLLSHPAIVAREFGIPAVVGSRTATTVIPDGATITVDGKAGTVTVA
jgi:pyruvate,water dikinase